jgi:anti-sigma regulatory factor (Ser/Thr protein kinase)
VETNLLECPVAGSTVLSLLPVTPQPRAAWSGVLPVAKPAAARARHDTTWFLRNCRDAPAGDLIELANLLISELVTNAYNAMSELASATVIEFSLRLFADRLLIEVIDCSPDHPVLNPPDDPSAENGRGLGIVAGLSSEWGYFRYQGRKIVYCILPIVPDASEAAQRAEKGRR